MRNKKYLRIFDPEENNKEIKFRNLEELVSILQEWLISDILIEAIYGTIEIKYEIADHLATGHMGEMFEKYGRKHKRAKLILDHIAKRD